MPTWQQLQLAWVYSFLEPNDQLKDQALAKASELLKAQEFAADLAGNETFAHQKLMYFALSGDATETRHWMEEHKRRVREESKGDVSQEAENLWEHGWALAVAGLEDEAVQQLETMLDQPGGHRFPFVDGFPAIDAIRDHPGYKVLRERFGDESEN
jgi:hypothetical protein